MVKQSKKETHEIARAKAKAAVSSKQNRMNLGDMNENHTISPWVNMLQFILIWAITVGLVSLASNGDSEKLRDAVTTTRGVSRGEKVSFKGFQIPKDLMGPYTGYPNPLGITEEIRQNFHPVVKFPKIRVKNEENEVDVPDYEILDHTTSSSLTQLATEQQREAKRQELKRHKPFWQKGGKTKGGFAIGRYDENRVNLYSSELFHNTSNSIDGYKGMRTLHVGIDLDCPVGTNVYAFTGGVIHSAGYNSDLGDYGNVIVVEHELHGACLKGGESEDEGSKEHVQSSQCKVWALYGHLDSKSIQRKSKGDRVKRGQVLGRVGDFHENGGWLLPHVHFQLSIHPPATHDMPGAVALENRSQALVDYPDPRWVLGPLY